MSKKTGIPKARYSLKNYMGVPLKKGQRLLLEMMRERGEIPARMREELEQIHLGKAKNPAFDDADSLIVNEKGEVEQVYYNPNHPMNIKMCYFRKKLGKAFGITYFMYVCAYQNRGEKNLNPEEKKRAEETCKYALEEHRKRLDGEERLDRGKLPQKQLIEELREDNKGRNHKAFLQKMRDNKILISKSESN